MSRIEQLRRRHVKLQKQIRREEVNKITGSKRRIVMSGGSTTDDYPLVLCPVCGEEVRASEAELDVGGNRWAYFYGRCDACHTDFRIGQVTDRCARCDEPFAHDPYYDINEFYHHWWALYQKPQFPNTFGTTGSFVSKVQKVGSSPNA